MNEGTVSGAHLRKTELMAQILEVRYTDVAEENRLCKELLGLAEPNQELYECTFAHVYLLDSFLAMGDYDSCAYHLIRAEELCRQNKYDGLLLRLCNFAGLYYTKLSNEQAAVKYHMEGVALADKLKDSDMKGTHYNNIGLAFGSREDFKSAKRYFSLAFKTMEPHITQQNVGNALNCLCNIAEMAKEMGDYSEVQAALKKCDSFAVENPYEKIRIASAWLSYFMDIDDKQGGMQAIKAMMDAGLFEFDDKFFVCFMMEGVVAALISFGELVEAKRYLDLLDSLETGTSLVNRYRTQGLKIKFWKAEGDREEYNRALKEYYEIAKQMSVADDKTCVQSMVSQIEIVRIKRERTAMRSENKELERLTQLDSLTGLYNRRYLSKLTTKAIQNAELVSLGYIMLDVDYFKQYNDFYGHFHGDKALKKVAKALSENAGKGIYAGRYGGDEFVCICVDLSDEEIGAYVDKVMKTLHDENIVHEKSGCSDRVTLSVGFYNHKMEPGVKPEEILERADRALYQAKKEGRNRAERLD